MNKKMFRYFYVLLILFIAINISFISASEIDQGNDAVSTQISSDEIGVDEVLQDGEGCSTDTNPVGTDTPGCSTDTNNPINENDGNGDDTGNDETPEEITLEKTSLSSVDYAIKNKYLNVYLKDSSKNAIANQKVTLTINGKTLSAVTNSNGIAKFNITNAAKTYKVTLNFEGDDKYESTSKTLNLRVIAKPIYTKMTIAQYGIFKGNCLNVYLKTEAGKAIANQTLKITINGKTYTRITKKNGLAKLKISLKSNIYSVTIKYAGKGNYIPVSKSTKVNVLTSKLIGKTSYGKVYFIGAIGNRSSKYKIAYVVGLHSMEHQIHDSLYKIIKNKVSMKYKYYVYRIVLTNKKGSYSTLRMRGQKLAKNYIVPHAKKQKFDLVADIHSTSGITYKQTYFIHVPKNQHAPSMKLAKKTIKLVKSIENNSKILYWSPPTQTSPPYIHLPLIKAGTPTFVFETWSYEKKSQTDKRAKILIQAIDKVFD
ncbi:MAG: Ig-like domain repeat protein [Methanobrevibacter sp.]|nr:Ig-like domain repeat protein [Methanobrevibacter sp.]